MTPDNRCHYHDGLIEGQATIAAELKGMHQRLDKLERILVGNGHEGLLAKFAKMSVMFGIGGGAVSIVVAMVVRHLLTV